ncbi:MAG: Holliday junction branch migration protein RuvA [Gammaproteobacteria bacterium]|nr:Holliday junction branch migration protein RuvA [Gammaproteobacteria bacterium]
MIGSIFGILIEKTLNTLLIDVNGLGYEVEVPMTTLYLLPAIGEKIKLYTHFVVREDAQQLYGFISQRDRRLFRELIKVNGIGSKSALSILSGMEADTFAQCIISGDCMMLVKIPGIGKKTAERLLIEMRDRLANWEWSSAAAGQLTGQTIKLANLDPSKQAEHDAISALVSLGYKPLEASKAISKLVDNYTTSDQLIRAALQGMMKSA